MSAAGLFGRGFDELREGERFQTRGRTIAEADLVSFSSLTGDWHPQHADAEWAARSRFGGRVAHGLLVLSYAVGLVPIDPERVVAMRGIEEAVFKRPVRIGDTIRVEGRVDALRPLDDELGLVGFLWKVVDQRGRLCARAKPSVLWRRGDGAAGDGADGEEAGLGEVYL